MGKAMKTILGKTMRPRHDAAMLPATKLGRGSFAAALMALLCAASIAAQTSQAPQNSRGIKIENMLAADARAEIQKNGRAVRAGDKTGPALIPDHPAAKAIRAAFEAEKPSILVETAFVLPRSAAQETLSPEADIARIYGILRSIGSLEGIQYWSASHKDWRTFYAESWRIDGPETKRRLPDAPPPAPGQLPSTETLYAWQKDLSFGGNIYRYTFASFEGAVTSELTNLTKMNYKGIATAATPEKLKTRLLVITANDGILFYAASGADSPAILRSKLRESFANRAEALFKWFAANYAAMR